MGTVITNQPKEAIMNFIHRSNREIHGARWAFDREYQKQLKAGVSEHTAFARAAAFVFNRYVPSAL